MKQRFSLRGHKAPITCFATVGNNVVSADREGWVILWDLTTRRPKALWRAHEGHVLTLKHTEEGLLTHGRDHSIRFWDLALLEGCLTSTMDIGGAVKPPPSFEIPVNALNFCNVDFCNGVLATASTGDSNNFDIYRVWDVFGAAHFARIAANVPPNPSDAAIEEVHTDSSSRQGLGIIMRLCLQSPSSLIVGYESGAVRQYSIRQPVVDKAALRNDRTVMFKDTKIALEWSHAGLTPLPILSIEVVKGHLYVGSASKSLLRYPMDGHKILGEPESFNLRHYGIQCVQPYPSGVVTGFWDGTIKGFDLNMQETFRLERGLELIRPQQDDNVAKTTRKSLCMMLHEPTFSESLSRRELMRQRRIGEDSLLFVGYGDAVIKVYL